MSQALDRAIDLVTLGQSVDWEVLLEEAADVHERTLIEDLRALTQLDVDNRPSTETPEESTVGTPPPIATAPQRRWGHLELLNDIGSGVHGTVYRAWDTRLAREVALKLLADDDAGRSLQEARRLARVSHPGVVSVYGADRIDGQVGLWMELVTGRTLDNLLQELGPLSARETVGMALEICGAIAAVHAAGVIHRDIKAQNVMRAPGGRLVLMDMGASIDVSRDDIGVASVAGTPLYMAPELFEGAAPSVASDMYAIGVLLYRLVTAEYPLEARTIGDVRRGHAAAKLRPLRQVRPDLLPSFVGVVERCLSRDPARRFPDVGALERALHEISGDSVLRRHGLHRGVRWPLLAAAVALAALAGTGFAWKYATRRVGAATTAAVAPEIYKVFAGYEELAFNRRIDDPRGAATATSGAFSQIRSALPGVHPVFALLNARLSESWRRAGDLQQAGVDLLDGADEALESVGEDHPYTALVAMELARNAQAAGDYRKAAAEILRALEIRWRVLGLSEFVQRRTPLLDVFAIERAARNISAADDIDGDGLLDIIEASVGLDPRSTDSDGNGVLDDDEDHDRDGVINRLALGLLASPFLTWTHSGAHQPRFLAWQSPAAFPMIERPGTDSLPAAWSVSAVHSQGYFSQRFSAAHSARAVDRGFSLVARVQPIAGLTSLVVDTAPAGARFDVAITRVNDRSIEVRLLSSVVPREGPAVVVDAPVGGRWPLLEMRYRPQWGSAVLYMDGRRATAGYTGNRQFQDPKEGAIAWGVAAAGGGDTRAAAAFNLVWLEIF